MKRKWLKIFIIIGVLSMLVACGKTEGSGVSSDNTPNTQVESESEEHKQSEVEIQTESDSKTEPEKESEKKDDESQKNESSCAHSFTDATCESAAKCSKCGEMKGAALGHKYKEADCLKSSTCERCGKKAGGALGHNYLDATCTKPATCSRCGATKGSAIGHNYSVATCTKKATCNNCGATTGSTAAHNYSKATCTKKATCTNCGATKGSTVAHTYTNGSCTVCGTSDPNYSPVYTYGDQFDIIPTLYDYEFLLSIGKTYKFETLDNRFSEDYGETYVGIPITIKNVGNTTAAVNSLTYDIELFSSNGIESKVAYYNYFDDSESLMKTKLRTGATISGYIYIKYTGAGYYYIDIEGKTKNVEIKVWVD